MEHLRSYLTDREMSAGDFAADIGVHPSIVYRWLAGDAKPSIENALAIDRVTDGAVPVAAWGEA